MIKQGMLGMIVAITISSLTSFAAPPPFTTEEIIQVKKLFFKNISTEQKPFERKNTPQLTARIGAVVASPAEEDRNFTMDYRVHWVRDAAIAMHEILALYQHGSEADKKNLLVYLNQYINFEVKAQEELLKKGEKNLGEPKFNIDATVWEGKWARPQNDGPALRAITNIKIANLFLNDPQKIDAWDKLLEMINNDLDYIVHEWTRPTYDLWEEHFASHHFFNKMVQRKALLLGSNLLEKLNEHQKAVSLKQEAKYLTDSLQAHWNSHAGFLVETLDNQDVKGGGLNSAVILGLLYGRTNRQDDPLALDADASLSSIYFIRNIFSRLYKINLANPGQPPLLGRYPNDVYDGKDSKYGNPWFLTTISLAHYYYALGQIYLQKGFVRITKDNLGFFQQIAPGLVTQENMIIRDKNSLGFFNLMVALEKAGDDYLKLIKKYAKCYDDSCLHLSEQIDRATGEAVSAKDLTWSYASLLLALQAREDLAKRLAKIQPPPMVPVKAIKPKEPTTKLITQKVKTKAINQKTTPKTITTSTKKMKPKANLSKVDSKKRQRVTTTPSRDLITGSKLSAKKPGVWQASRGTVTKTKKSKTPVMPARS